MNSTLNQAINQALQLAARPTGESWNKRFANAADAKGLKFIPVTAADCNEDSVHSPVPTPEYSAYLYPSLLVLKDYQPRA